MTEIPKVLFDKTVIIAKTSWLQLERLTYYNNGKYRNWDRVVRCTKENEEHLDVVFVLASIKKDNCVNMSEEKVLVVKQFRPAVNGYTIELPAGIIDKGETCVDAAIRELKEECGYVGERKTNDCSPPLPLSSGLTNETMSLVNLEIDLSREENKNPIQHLSEDEFCSVIMVSKKNLKEELENIIREGNNIRIGCALWMLAFGIQLGMKSI